MAEKGFNLKVLIPTDNGLTISTKGIEDSSYYLMYNVSNRSYQLAGKIKVSDYFNNQEFDFDIFGKLCEDHKIDKILTHNKDLLNNEINEVLNQLIDIVDKKTS